MQVPAQARRHQCGLRRRVRHRRGCLHRHGYLHGGLGGPARPHRLDGVASAPERSPDNPSVDGSGTSPGVRREAGEVSETATSDAEGRIFGRMRTRMRGWRGAQADDPKPSPPSCSPVGAVGSGAGRMLAELVARGIIPDRIYGASVGAVNGRRSPATDRGGHRAPPRGVAQDQRGRHLPRTRHTGPGDGFSCGGCALEPRAATVVEEGSGLSGLGGQDPVEVVATSLTDGRERWFTHGPLGRSGDGLAAIPAILPPVDIDGDLLMDGGVVNNVRSPGPSTPGRRGSSSSCAAHSTTGPCSPVARSRPCSALCSSPSTPGSPRAAELPPGVEVTVFRRG